MRCKKPGHGLHDYSARLVRLFHHRAEVFPVAGEQMGRLASERGKKNRPILLRQSHRTFLARARRNNAHGWQKPIHSRNRVRILQLQVVARFFDGVCTGQYCPSTLPAQFDEQCGFSRGIVSSSEEDIGVKINARQRLPLPGCLTSLRRSAGVRRSSASQRAICSPV